MTNPVNEALIQWARKEERYQYELLNALFKAMDGVSDSALQETVRAFPKLELQNLKVLKEQFDEFRTTHQKEIKQQLSSVSFGNGCHKQEKDRIRDTAAKIEAPVLETMLYTRIDKVCLQLEKLAQSSGDTSEEIRKYLNNIFTCREKHIFNRDDMKFLITSEKYEGTKGVLQQLVQHLINLDFDEKAPAIIEEFVSSKPPIDEPTPICSLLSCFWVPCCFKVATR